MNSTIHLTTTKKDTDSVPIVIYKRKYATQGLKDTEFRWQGIFYPLQKIWRATTNFLNNWANSLEKELSRSVIELSKDIKILNTETGNFETASELPENISILIQENININER